MKDKLILILSFTTVFSLGCATASVLVATASADPPPPGQEQCVAFTVGVGVGDKNVDERIASQARTLPPGWRALSGSATGSTVNLIFACRGSV